MDWKKYHEERKESNDKLKEDFPLLFEKEVSAGMSHPKGWDEIIRDTCEMLSVVIGASNIAIQITQTKEKFGHLRFYVHISGDVIWSQVIRCIVASAESRSSSTCVDCGKYGSRETEKGWISTLCSACKDEKEESMKIFEDDK